MMDVRVTLAVVYRPCDVPASGFLHRDLKQGKPLATDRLQRVTCVLLDSVRSMVNPFEG